MDNKYIEDLVSVIIPVYNIEKYIKRTIDSVQKQTYSNLEIIIIDDCSTDNTISIVRDIASLDKRIKLIVNEKNSGAGITRNKGISIATGRYIAFLDSDDLWLDTKIEKQLDELKKSNLGMSFCSYDYINESDEIIRKGIKVKRIFKYKNLLTKTMIATPTVIYDRNVTENPLMPSRRTGQDYAFWFILLKKTDAVALVEPLVHVRKRQGSLSKNKLQNIKDVWEVQTKQEGINKFKACINIVRYCFYVLKKKFF